MLRTGRLCEALDLFEKIGGLCPGSRYEAMANALVAEAFKLVPGAAEEAEKGTGDQFPIYNPPVLQQKEEEVPHSETRIQEIERHLNMAVSLHYENTPLREVLEDLRQRYGLDIHVDERASVRTGR